MYTVTFFGKIYNIRWFTLYIFYCMENVQIASVFSSLRAQFSERGLLSILK
jgi:hypothetical protein